MAVELPGSSPFVMQTNGAPGPVTLGDWYSFGGAGGGSGFHYLQFWVPCGWPAGSAVHIDLYSAEMNGTFPAGFAEEPSGAPDSTQFELYGPGVTVGPGFASPAPGAGIGGTRDTFQPDPGSPTWDRYETLAAPVACGSYVLRSQLLTTDPLNPGGSGDDQNGWRVRVGLDNDGDPTTAPPANTDDPDGIAGTNDEIVVGFGQFTTEQDSGALACQTFYQYVDPGLASVTFNNFDMDGNTRVRYYAPGDPTFDPTATTGGTVGTVSGNGLWNGGTLTTRVGDTIVGPASGWWRLVNCLSSNNQLIQEGQTGRPVFYSQPPTPDLQISKTDGVANVSPGETVTYTITVDNAAAGAGAGAANSVVVLDTLPSQFTFQSCAIPTPAQGTWSCSESGGVVTFTQTGWIDAGDAAELTVTATVDQGATGSKTNTVMADYTDLIGNPFPQVSATDVDTILPVADLQITKTDSADPVNPGQAFTYTLTATNAGPSDATGVTVSDTVPPQFTVTGVSTGPGSCGFVGNAVTCTRAAFPASASWSITISVTVDPSTPAGTYSDTADVNGADIDSDPTNDSDTESTTVVLTPVTADLSLTKTVDDSQPAERDTIVYTIRVTNGGPADATGVVVNDVLAAGVTFRSADVSQGTFHPGTGDWDVGDLAVGDHARLHLEVRVNAGTAGTRILNTASVAGLDQTDPDASDDADTAPIVVEASAPGGSDGSAGTGLGAADLIGALLLLGAIGMGALAGTRARRSHGLHVRA